jgi:hypothetical protein
MAVQDKNKRTEADETRRRFSSAASPAERGASVIVTQVLTPDDLPPGR